MTYKTLIKKISQYGLAWKIERGAIVDERGYDPIRAYYHHNIATPTGSTGHHAEQLKLPMEDFTEFYIACICSLHLINRHHVGARKFRKALLKTLNLEEDNVSNKQQKIETEGSQIINNEEEILSKETQERDAKESGHKNPYTVD